MTANATVRVLGNLSGLSRGEPTITDWVAPLRQELANRAPLPAPPPRPATSSRRLSSGTGAATHPASLRQTRPGHIPTDSLRGRVWDQAEDAARILQDMVLSDRDASVKVDAGILLVALGDEVAGEVMKSLNYWAVCEATRAVSRIKEVEPKDEERVLNAFDVNLRARQWIRQGGLEYARRLLERAVGRGRATSILEATAEFSSTRFQILHQLPPKDVAPFIVHEHPQTIALILSQLEPDRAAATLDQLAVDLQKDVAYRIATLENVTPAVLKLVEESVEATLRNIIGGHQDVGGPRVLADILNQTGSSTERTILDSLENSDVALGDLVRNLMPAAPGTNESPCEAEGA